MFCSNQNQEHEYLTRLTFSNAKKFYGEQLPDDVYDRLNYELKIIKEHRVSDYFLFLQEVVLLAETELGARIGPGRGTSASSLVNYCLGITKIDPLKFDLLFERFLDPKGTAIPDIDLDVEGKERVLDWVKQKYSDGCNPQNIEIDLFGSDTLSLMRTAIEKIKESKGISVDIERIPIEDTKTFRLFQDGMTDDIFQFEREEMSKILIDFHPTCFEDLVVINSLYRVGFVDDIRMLIKRKTKSELIKYPISSLGKYLHNTYGLIVYQEQIMLISRLLSNFTRVESDMLRRAVGKKTNRRASYLESTLYGRGYQKWSYPANP